MKEIIAGVCITIILLACNGIYQAGVKAGRASPQPSTVTIKETLPCR